jgi:hypothetical protein
MNIVWPSNTTDVVDAIREAAGRPITINYIASVSGCSNPTDSLDPISNKSTNSLCPTCSGQYWIPKIAHYTVNAIIQWGVADDAKWYTGGETHEGDCTAQIKYDASVDHIYQTSMTAVVDNRQMTIHRAIFRGTPTVNRVILVMFENLAGGTIVPA